MIRFLVFLVLVSFGGVLSEKDIGRRRVVPVIHVVGSHYDVGFDVGRNFEGVIKEFLATFASLRDFEKQYKTEAGREAYEKTLSNMLERYPYYVKEVQGIADGAKVPFHQLFLLHMDDIIDTVNDNQIVRNDTGGCSSVAINTPQANVLGHTEDALSETLNHFYILSAHIIPTLEDQQKGAVEERFASLCYAGQLPGYTSGFNEHGMVFSINTLSPKALKPGGTPRTFITRAMLAAKSVEEVERVLTDKGLGIGNGFSLNLFWTNPTGPRQLFNIEVAPELKADRSQINIQKYEMNGDALVHCNKYQRLNLTEVRGPIIDSSVARLSMIHGHAKPTSKGDVENIISDISGKEFRVFEDRKTAQVKTICAGIFDLDQRSWSLYINQPNSSEPVATIPIVFTF
ncbi:isopenicillin-N N-acyltransferase isoform X1 [Plutella xylostella]|uniref:isopenicillin-N N-acyltransferase isoform X1 n=1 Tax=Plutella xylostella TaxID=51655 RepID=UPI0020322317|nr:isopenicillin-N N-acyltransferase isoform X1 [Plutella xylostella]